MAIQFIHLRVHSEYSLVDGIVRMKPLAKQCIEKNMPAVALTDQSNLFAAVKYYKTVLDAGLKPLLGADVWVANPEHPEQPFSLLLLCRNLTGYRKLTELISQGYLKGQSQGRVLVEPEWVAAHADGLIALSGAHQGEIGHYLLAGEEEKAKQRLQYWSDVFPDSFYIELQRIGHPKEESYIHAVLPLAQSLDLPIVATNAVCFLQPEDFEAHEARVCIHDGYVLSDNKRPQNYTTQQYLRSPEEMAECFSDLPQALQNTVEIAKRCNLEISLGDVFLPDFPVPPGSSPADYMAQLSREGLEKRFSLIFPGKTPEERSDLEKPYWERLKIELDVINDMGFAGYFLIVADFIQWAKRNDIPVGPGRGSGAGSLVAYVLEITDLDPLRYELLFERFLNPERVSMPDFDIDFCMEQRDRVIDYVANKYGRKSVSQIITYGTMAARAVVRDVGRVLGFPYGFVDKLAKLIPFELGITLDKALEEDALKERYDDEDDVRSLFDLALKLEGVVRNAGKHAGGVVIAPGCITDFAPLFCEPGSANLVTQFDKDDVEAVGLVKFDFLGLRTLTIIDWALKAVNQRREKNGESPIDIATIPTDDVATFDLLKDCQTTAVFQLESRGMKDLIKRLQPDCFEDIVALVALFRPGPLQSGMVDDFIDRKHGRAEVVYDHPDLEPILETTYGVILYQEQVMKIAQVLAGFSLGAADLLRRAMGKKKPEEMAKQRKIFLDGSGERGIDKKLAGTIFDLMEKFAGYGFNKSHSAAYALLAYQTAWLKAHYPAEFMAAVLSSDMDHTDKVVGFIHECRHMGLSIIPPHLSHSEYAFHVNDQGEIVYGLGAIKGVGEAAIDIMLDERNTGGVFESLPSFCQRVGSQKVNRRVVDALIRCGAMDQEGIARASLLASLEQSLKMAEQSLQSEHQLDLFSNDESDVTTLPLIEVPEASQRELLRGEKETLGLYFSGHPMDLCETELLEWEVTPIAGLKPTNDQTVLVAGLVMAVRTMTTKKGDRMAIVTLQDKTERIEFAVFPDAYQSYRELLIKDELLVVEGEVSLDEYSGGYRISCRQLWTMAQMRIVKRGRLTIDLQGETTDASQIDQVQETLQAFAGGDLPVQLRYVKPTETATFSLPRARWVNPSDDLLEKLLMLLGPTGIRVEYPDPT